MIDPDDPYLPSQLRQQPPSSPSTPVAPPNASTPQQVNQVPAPSAPTGQSTGAVSQTSGGGGGFKFIVVCVIVGLVGFGWSNRSEVQKFCSQISSSHSELSLASSRYKIASMLGNGEDSSSYRGRELQRAQSELESAETYWRSKLSYSKVPKGVYTFFLARGLEGAFKDLSNGEPQERTYGRFASKCPKS